MYTEAFYTHFRSSVACLQVKRSSSVKSLSSPISPSICKTPSHLQPGNIRWANHMTETCVCLRARGAKALRSKYINKQTIISTTKGISWLQRYFHSACNNQKLWDSLQPAPPNPLPIRLWNGNTLAALATSKHYMLNIPNIPSYANGKICMVDVADPHTE